MNPVLRISAGNDPITNGSYVTKIQYTRISNYIRNNPVMSGRDGHIPQPVETGHIPQPVETGHDYPDTTNP